MPPEAAYNQDLVATRHKPLLKLAAILDSSEDTKEVRLVAATVARMKPMEVPEPKSTDAPASAALKPAPRASPASPVRTQAPDPPSPDTSPATSQHPLTNEELILLTLLLPSVNPARFLKKHTPEYWREVIRRNLPKPQAACPAATQSVPQTGPPAAAAAA